MTDNHDNKAEKVGEQGDVAADGPGKGISRRSFLKILGSASAAGVAGCADKASQNIFPNVRGEEQQIPGVAVWYNSTCTECSAGCGISVRTREGRAVKIEGNPNNPVNRGGLCALGQASLQSLYDPDRVRQPLKKEKDAAGNTIFKAITWEDAYARVTKALNEAKQKKAFVTGELSGAIDDLANEWSSKLGVERASYGLLEPVSAARASELVFGVYGVPAYKFDRADTVLNFGADFLETWVSPCEYARDWAIGRRKKNPLKLIHVEPRLSLTGANADLWISANAGTEVRIALAVLKVVLEKKGTQNLRDDSQVNKLVAGVNLAEVSAETGVPLEKILLVAEYLSSGESSLVLAGGAAASTNNPLPLFVVTNLINLALGNVGKTVIPAAVRKPKSTLPELKTVIESLKKNEVDVLFLYGGNPVFTLPGAYEFKYSAKRAGLIVSFSSHIDETTELADLILPAHTGLESWGDSREAEGVYSLVQPVMQPVFDTRSLGDSLLEIARRADKPVGSSEDFLAYLKDSWKKIHSSRGGAVPSDFQRFWNESLERGGYFAVKTGGRSASAQISSKAFDLSFASASFDTKGSSDSDLVLYPFPSVKSFDGRAANRPWLQELPDPVTQVVWDSWAEIHPDTARAKGLAQGDMVTVRNFYGEVNLPVYISKYVSKGIVAVPIGQGHTSYGRFAKKVAGGNVLELLPASSDPDSVALLGARVSVQRGRGRSTMVSVQGSDSQLGRGLAQTTVLSAGAAHAKGHADHDDHGHGHHDPKQMYDQRPHPVYRWGMAVDLAACTGCSACVVACYAENNIPVVGKQKGGEGREMSWLRIERYYDGGDAEELKVNFLPMMCQHCGNAPCEPVCPVYATYHNEEGLNAMIYNRCVGTRYCSNNCSYKVRRFNWFEYDLDSPLDMQLNPDVMKRSVGVMEKCSFCVQRIAEAKDRAKDLGRLVEDGEVKPACVQSCPTEALAFGNLNDPKSKVSRLSHHKRGYKILDHHLNTQPSITYLKDIRYKL